MNQAVDMKHGVHGAVGQMEPKQTEIDMHLQRVEVALSEIDKRFSVIATKLTPVLSEYSEPRDGSKDTGCPVSAPLSARLDNLVERLCIFTDALDDLASRIKC